MSSFLPTPPVAVVTGGAHIATYHGISSQTYIFGAAGANGFLGTELTKQLLDRGYTVRATMRKISPENTLHIERLAKALPGALEVVQADLSINGSFDKALSGATFLFHSASPVTFGSGNSDEGQRNVVEPAVNGTTTVLRSAATVKSLKRVVLTSSTAAVRAIGDSPSNGVAFTEADWNDAASLESAPYPFSKVQAEKAGWELAEELGIDLVTILPSLIIGPLTRKRSGISSDVGKGVAKGDSFEKIPFKNQVDVRDVAKAHIRAAETPSASGRYIISDTHTTNWTEVSDALKPLGLPIADAEGNLAVNTFDTSKARKELGMKLIPVPIAFQDMMRTMLVLGAV